MAATTRIDWGEAIAVDRFYGRERELGQLTPWISEERCRLVALLGTGGIGKTTLAVKLVQQVHRQFEMVIWRSLRDAPLLEDLIRDILSFLCQEPDDEPPKTLKEGLMSLIQQLRENRCLIILDNFDTLYVAGEKASSHTTIYENYGILLEQIAELPHQSCLLITSREKPRLVSRDEGDHLPVRSLLLKGLNLSELEQICQDKGLEGTYEQLFEISSFYRGILLYMKVAASTIIDLFGGYIEEFLQQSTFIVEGIDSLLDQQMQRLSPLEWQIMFWLAINQEPVTPSQLQADIISGVSRGDLLKALESLARRSLIESTSTGNTVQPVVMEFVTEQFLNRLVQEFQTGELEFFRKYALIRATAKDFIRESQIRIILLPLLEKLLFHYHNPQNLRERLHSILSEIKNNPNQTGGYAIGNLLNLFRALKMELTGLDISGCQSRQAYLPDFPLHQFNLTGATLKDSVFAESIGSVIGIDFSADGSP
jgi:hypothetical protein